MDTISAPDTISGISELQQISLAQVLDPDVIAVYSKRATGEQYLTNPNQQ